MSGHVQPLGYARKPPRTFVIRHWKLLLFLMICIAIGVPVYRNWQPFVRQVTWIYWSRKAAGYQMPARSIELIVPEKANTNRLFSGSSDYVTVTHPKTTTQPVAAYAPSAYRHLLQIDPRLRWLGNDTSGSHFGPVAYLGTLRRPDGIARLVVVVGADRFRPLEAVRVAVLPLPGLFDPPPSAIPNRTKFQWHFYSNQRVEIQSGVTDSRDPSHLIFPFVVGEPGDQLGIPQNAIIGHGEIDAFLQNDDTLNFKLKGESGPIHTEIFGPTT